MGLTMAGMNDMIEKEIWKNVTELYRMLPKFKIEQQTFYANDILDQGLQMVYSTPPNAFNIRHRLIGSFLQENNLNKIIVYRCYILNEITGKWEAVTFAKTESGAFSIDLTNSLKYVENYIYNKRLKAALTLIEERKPTEKIIKMIPMPVPTTKTTSNKETKSLRYNLNNSVTVCLDDKGIKILKEYCKPYSGLWKSYQLKDDVTGRFFKFSFHEFMEIFGTSMVGSYAPFSMEVELETK